MKLLIFTQKVDANDDVLGFFHGWIAEFGRQCEKVTVVCLFEGKHHLPDNVRVLSLGKEELEFGIRNKELGKTEKEIVISDEFSSPTIPNKMTCYVRVALNSVRGLIVKLKYLYRFYKYIWHFSKEYDNIFVHMNPIYAVLGGLYWRLTGKKIGLWYAHGHVPFVLRLAEKLVDVIFTSTPEGFRLPSRKVKVVGQGISLRQFPIPNSQFPIPPKIITVGRISPVKNYETLIKAVKILRERDNISTAVTIVGGTGLKEHETYQQELESMIKAAGLEDSISFAGPVPADKVPEYLGQADIFVNTSLTGSLDKVILEAMAAGLPALTCNEAAAEVIGQYADKLMFSKQSPEDLADKLKALIGSDPAQVRQITDELRDKVVKEHSLESLVGRILGGYPRG